LCFSLISAIIASEGEIKIYFYFNRMTQLEALLIIENMNLEEKIRELKKKIPQLRDCL